MSDPILAITRMDVEDLSRIMSSGWSPPIIRAKHSRTPDHAAWTEVILRDWVDGLKILDQYYPKISRSADIWRIALRNASHNCLEYLWDKRDVSPNQFTNDDHQDIVVGLATAMGEPWSPAYEVRDILPSIKLFSEKGVNLNAVIPGEFEPGDFRMAGHSLFTRALASRRWDVVVATWPDPTRDLPSWPRLDEVLVGILDVIGGDYRPLVASSVNDARSRIEAVPFRDIYFKPGSFQQIGVAEDRFMLAWMKDFHTQWPTTDPQLLSALCLPSRSQIAPWLRLPLLAENAVSRVDENGKPRVVPDTLSPDQLRKPIWAAWERVLANDPSQSWLRSLAMYPQDPEVNALLDLLRSEAPHILAQYWELPSEQDTLSPAQIWDLQKQNQE